MFYVILKAAAPLDVATDAMYKELGVTSATEPCPLKPNAMLTPSDSLANALLDRFLMRVHVLLVPDEGAVSHLRRRFKDAFLGQMDAVLSEGEIARIHQKIIDVHQSPTFLPLPPVSSVRPDKHGYVRLDKLIAAPEMELWRKQAREPLDDRLAELDNEIGLIR